MTDDQPAATDDGDDPTHDLLQLAKDEHRTVWECAEGFEVKARTFLTINSLLIGSGVLATMPMLQKISVDEIRLLITVCLGSLLATSVVAFLALIDVFGLRDFHDAPDALATLQDLRGKSGRAVREDLALHYAENPKMNARSVEAIRAAIERGIRWTRFAFVAFIATIGLILVASICSPNIATPIGASANQHQSADGSEQSETKRPEGPRSGGSEPVQEEATE